MSKLSKAKMANTNLQTTTKRLFDRVERDGVAECTYLVAHVLLMHLFVTIRNPPPLIDQPSCVKGTHASGGEIDTSPSASCS